MKKILLLLGIALTATFVIAEDYVTNKQIANRIQYAKNKEIMCTARLKCKSPLLSKFYANRKNSLAWIKDGELTASGLALVHAIESSNMDGLDPRTYHVIQIDRMVALLSESNSVAADSDLVSNLDITLTDGLLLYINNLVYGLQNGKKIYPDWPIANKKVDILDVADKISHTDDVTQALLNVGPKYPGYAKLREKLADYYRVAAIGGWETIPDGDTLQKGSKGDRVHLLQKRLYISGELDSIEDPGEFDSDLEKAVMQYQQNNGIDEDGAVGPQTLRALNVPVGSRIRQIELNMDRMRFLSDTHPARYVVVNVPDYSLETIEDGKIKLLSAVVVGKPDHKTCILNSDISTIELNPFWNIPSSIASKEMLPEIKANPKYLADNDIKVFKVEGSKYSEIDPKSVDWKKIESGNLNFRFRQNPGEDNALGKLKFIFPNNCSIYLHDSLYPELFDETKRGFSHGCIRVGDPVEFANFLLEPNKDWTDKKLNSELDAGTHKFVKLTNPVHLNIIYLTAWYDADDDYVEFRDDIYHFDKLSLYPLYLPKKNTKHRNASNPDSSSH